MALGLVRRRGINVSPEATVAMYPSSAPKGQPQFSLGQSDPRERRPKSPGWSDQSSERAKQSGASPCDALSGLARQAGLDSQGVALGWFVGAPSGRKQGTFIELRQQCTSRTRQPSNFPQLLWPPSLRPDHEKLPLPHPSKLPIEFHLRQFQRSRPSMRAVVVVIAQVPLVQESCDLFLGESVSRLDGGFAGHHV